MKSGTKPCTCGLAIRINSTVAAKAIAELSKHDRVAAEKIIEEANTSKHKDWCGSATAYLSTRIKRHTSTY